MFRTRMLGLLVAVSTAASLTVRDVHGFLEVVVIVCAALAAGLVAWAKPVQKKAFLDL